MLHFEKPDISPRRGIPWSLRLMALAVILMFVVMRACSHRTNTQSLHIGVVTIEQSTPVYAEITVPIANRSKHYFERKKILIKLYLQDGTLFKDRLTVIDIPPKSEKTHRFVIEKFDRALLPNEKIVAATVEFYHGAFE